MNNHFYSYLITVQSQVVSYYTYSSLARFWSDFCLVSVYHLCYVTWLKFPDPQEKIIFVTSSIIGGGLSYQQGLFYLFYINFCINLLISLVRSPFRLREKKRPGVEVVNRQFSLRNIIWVFVIRKALKFEKFADI